MGKVKSWAMDNGLFISAEDELKRQDTEKAEQEYMKLHISDCDNIDCDYSFCLENRQNQKQKYGQD